MLICNNCFHENEDGVTLCANCRMKDNFTFSENGERISDEGRKEAAETKCFNCGNPSPGDGDCCVHCRFPIPSSGLETDATAAFISKSEHHVQKKQSNI